MKSKYLITMMVPFFLLTSSCIQPENQITSDSSAILSEENEIDSNDTDFTGVWTTNGYPSNTIYTDTGGGILSIRIDKNHVTGSYTYIQGTSYRIASIDTIDAEVISSIAEYQFDDDGWGNSGTIQLIFEENKIRVEILQLILHTENTTGMSISNAVLYKEGDVKTDAEVIPESDDMELSLTNRSIYRNGNQYWDEVTSWDESNGRTGLDRPLEPLLHSDTQSYSKDELTGYPQIILYLAKNEIYARHGYIFENTELQNYFLGQSWYTPAIESKEFDDNVLNEYEVNNLQLILDVINE